MKSFLESLDLAVKIAIAVAAFLLWGGEKERIEIQTKQAEIQKEQANAEKALAESSQVKQQMNLTVVDKLVTLLSGYEQQCISEERQTFITYLIRVNDAYSLVPFPPDAASHIFAAHKNCGGKDLQVVTPANYSTIQPNVAEKVAPASEGQETPDGYVALGAFYNKTYRNFQIVPTAPADGVVKAGDIMKANWSVYLRTNSENTESGTNPSLGIIPDDHCVKILDPRDGIRGQTWAAVKLAKCPDV